MNPPDAATKSDDVASSQPTASGARSVATVTTLPIQQSGRRKILPYVITALILAVAGIAAGAIARAVVPFKKADTITAPAVVSSTDKSLLRLTPGKAIKLKTGGEVCILKYGGSVLFDFAGQCIFDTNANNTDSHSRVPILAGHQIIVQQQGQQHTIRVTECESELREGSGSGPGFMASQGPQPELIGCDVSVKSVATTDPDAKPKKVTHSVLIGSYGDDEKFYNEDPLIYRGEGFTGTPTTIGQLWKSTKCPDKKYCHYIQTEKVDYTDDPMANTPVTFEFVTRRGLATFTYTLEEIYTKQSKTATLSNAFATLKVTSLSYECAQYCDDPESSYSSNNLSVQQPSVDTKGQIFNQFKLELTYTENGA